MMKVTRQIASSFNLRLDADKFAVASQPGARTTPTPSGALQALARLPQQPERLATTLPPVKAVRLRIDMAELRNAVTRTSRTGDIDCAARRSEKIPLPLEATRRIDAVTTVAVSANDRVSTEAEGKAESDTARSLNSGLGRPQESPPASPQVVSTGIKKIIEPTHAGVASSDTSVHEYAAVPVAADTCASIEPFVTTSAKVTNLSTPSTFTMVPRIKPASALGVDGKVRDEFTALGQQINTHVNAMRLATNENPLQASTDLFLQQAIALRELALLLSDLMRQLIRSGGQAAVSLTAN